MDLSIITPVWNRSQLTWQYLSKSLIYLNPGHSKYEIEFIIVDNGSTDNTIDVVSRIKTQANIEIISNQKNLGFSIACNQGANLASGRNLLFLNNDIIVKGNYASIIIDFLDNQHKIIVGAEIHEHDTGWNVFGNEIVKYIPGWCLALKYDDFFELGSFDTRYSPCDYEDMDLSLNAQKQGYTLVRLPVPIDHISGQSGLQIGVEERKEITRRNRLKFAEKWGL